tara:strand:- start:6539 stop:7522 length:984 start_codon:yes stop_codon:yes gene_type:complete
VNDTANTIDAAVEQLIQVPNTTTEDTTEEVVEASSEEIIEEPQQETDVVEQAENDADDDLLDQLDADDLEEETAAPLELSDDLEIEYKADGQMKKATLGELKRDKAGQDYIQRRMQEIAQLQKQVQEQSNALAQQQNQQAEFFKKAQQNGLSEPIPPSKDLFESDPIAFMQSKLEYDEAKAEYDTNAQHFLQMEQQSEQRKQQQLQAFTQQQTQLLSEKLPDIADPEKGEVIKKGLMEVGEHYGFTPQELESVRDHRYILAMYDAMRFRKLVQKRGKATSKKQSIAPVKAGAKKMPNVGNAKARKQKQDRLRKTGSIDDAVDLILNS